MKRFRFIAALGFSILSTQAFAQFGSGIVYDPTQGAHAIQQIQQFEQQIQKAEQQIQKAEQIYTTALQTRNTIVSAYNLAHQLSMAPQQLYRRYVTPWTNWNTVVAVNSYSARIEFVKVFTNPADHAELKRQRWTASVTYVFRPVVQNNEVQVNPLGLTLVKFRADQAFE